MTNTEKVVVPGADKPAAKEETIVVNKGVLEGILAKLESLEKDNVMLKHVADKSRIAYWEDARKVKGPNHYGVATCKGKIVMGWRTLTDLVERNFATGVIYVKQQYELILEDNSTVAIDGYNNFAEAQYGNQIDVEEISSRVTPEGATMLKVRDLNGREFEIDRVFVN